MKRQIELLVIDPQNDFCDLPEAYRPVDPMSGLRVAPALPVAGAHADMQRTAKLIREGAGGLTGIAVTLDSHHRYDIAHPTFWQTGGGEAVKPFTPITAAQVRQGRREVTAPEAGTVVHLRYFSIGAVVSPGGPILDLVPRDDRLVIEARVRPTDIDVVHVGLPARVIFNAFKMRTTPQLEGTVALVSADAMTDERTGVPYYTARIVVDAKELDKLGKRQLQPGMPAETMIVTGERTMLEYLLQPINDTFRTAFREE